MTAGRSVKTGLISVDIQSHWTWSSTLLQSVSGPYWYAGAAVVQILCFGIIAVYIKKRAPSAHTVLEIVHARWGTGARICFFYFLMVTAIIVSGQLILGGSAVINALTGMNIYAAIFIIPFTVVIYAATGGLKAVSCWGITIVDQAYWQSAIAARPSAAYKGYIIGGLLWLAIPLGLGNALGLGVRALDLPVTPLESGSGLTPPAVAEVILGKFGTILIIIMILMAITSAGSAEMVSFSSLVTYDLYKPYFDKNASNKRLLLVSRLSIAFFGLVMAVASVIFYKANINLNFLYFLMATAICGGVPPLAASITWARCSKFAAITAAFVGQAMGIAAWLVECHIEFGVLNTTTLQQIGPALTGGCFSLFISLILVVVLSWLVPQHYDWKNMASIQVYSDITRDKRSIAKEESIEALNKAERTIWIWAGVLTFVFLFGWPLLTLPAGVWSKGYFTFYIVLSFVWALVAAVLALSLPIIESRHIIYAVLGSFLPGCSFLTRWAEQHDLEEQQQGQETIEGAQDYKEPAVDATPAPPLSKGEFHVTEESHPGVSA
ncbi:hypothetical protein WJX73_003159 [Symbiochloris irregularis]|uniref:Uncharacterized protein n=1 Tax=Symbiochloris irregularis TaxID=706552 RepID=A0AAW1P4H7_9CHLO